MNTVHSPDRKAAPDHTREPQVLPQPSGDRPLSSKARASRNAAAWLWSALAALFVAIVGIWAYSAIRDAGEDRGIRGPADQAAPHAPKDEKQRPSSVGR